MLPYERNRRIVRSFSPRPRVPDSPDVQFDLQSLAKDAAALSDFTPCSKMRRLEDGKEEREATAAVMPRKHSVGDGGSAAQKRALGALPDAVRATKKSSTPVASDTTAEKGAADKNKATTNRNLAQGKESDAVRTATSYFDPVWNAFSKHTDGSMQWIPKQIVAIGEDFHSQVGDGKVRTTLYKVRWEGYDKKDDTWEPITHLQGYATMVKSS
jgi:hypothetical protein